MSFNDLPDLNALPDYVPYASLLKLGVVLLFLLGAVSILLLRLMGRYTRLQHKYDTLAMRHQRSEEQLNAVWKKGVVDEA